MMMMTMVRWKGNRLWNHSWNTNHSPIKMDHNPHRQQAKRYKRHDWNFPSLSIFSFAIQAAFYFTQQPQYKKVDEEDMELGDLCCLCEKSSLLIISTYTYRHKAPFPLSTLAKIPLILPLTKNLYTLKFEMHKSTQVSLRNSAALLSDTTVYMVSGI